jgi:hypothetical protein
MGDTGDARGTPFHLHFEMHPDAGWAVPPIAYVTAWQSATPGVGSASAATSLPPAASPPATPEGAVLDQESDISSVNGLDDAALAQAVGEGAEGAGPAPQPDAIVAVGSESAPGFIGLTG